jgi:hypothetical protein
MTLRSEVLTQVAALMTAAFGLVAALAWNGAIQPIFKQVFENADSITAQLSYAVIVTIIAVIATFMVTHSVASAKSETP